MLITPTVGRVVWYYPNGAKVGPQPHAALVAYVHGDRCVNLACFDANGLPYAATSVVLRQEGDEAPAGSYCCWMPYQLGQAKKAAS